MKLIFVLIFIYNWSPWKEVLPYEKGCFTYRWKAETYDQKKLLDEQIPFPLRADEAHWDNWKNTSINAIKALRSRDIPGKKRGMPSQKREIYTDKACLITGLERDGNCFIRALNMKRPSTEDIKGYSKHIAQKTYMWTDGL